MSEAETLTNLLKLLAMRGEDETGGWENCSLLLRCCFRFCKRYETQLTIQTLTMALSDENPSQFLTSVLTSRTDLKSLDIEANLDCVK